MDEHDPTKETPPDAATAESTGTNDAPWTQEQEQMARSMGWKSPDEWHGKEPRGGLVDDPRDFTPMRAVQERLDGITEHIQRDFERRAQQDKADYDRRVAEIETRKRDAVENADGRAYDAAVAEQRTLKAPEPFEPPKPVEQRPIAEQFPDAQWLRNDGLYSAGISVIDAALRKGRTFAGPEDQVKYAEQQLRMLHPHMFEKPKSPADPVDGGGLAGASKSEGYASLPADAKAAFAQMARAGVYEDTAEGRKKYYDGYSNQ